MTLQNLASSSRTNDSFRQQRDKLHHKGRSPLLSLPIDMVKDFPLDYMHLVCLGVVKRLLKIWVMGAKVDLPNRLSQANISLINERILNCSLFLSSEFNRKGRILEDFCRWKAVEFRSFLLYTGVIVLKGVLPTEKYDHFLKLHTAIRILSSPKSTEPQFRYASRCLKSFVQDFGKIYGVHNLVFNVHNLCHLADDCIHFKGPLDNYSSFPFESYLGQMKKMLRGTRKPLAQLYKRIQEIENHTSIRWLMNEQKYKMSNLKNNLKLNSRADSLYCIGGDQIVKVISIDGNTFKASSLILKRDAMCSPLDFYDAPVKSTDLELYIATGIETSIKEYHLDVLRNGSKQIALPYTNDDEEVEEYLIIPLLHHMT